jgi:hypothetical protein
MNQNYIHGKIKSRQSGECCYHAVQNVLCSCLVSKNVQIKIFKTITVPVVLCGCKTWSLAVREEQGAKENIWT